MKKKIMALLLTTVMLAGCGSNNTSESTETTDTTTSTETETSSETTETTEITSDDPSVTLKLAFSTNEEDPRAKAAEQFKAEVEEKTNGSVTVEIYPSGQLGGDSALIEAMALDSGTVDIIITDASNFATYEPKMGISALPFQFSTFEDAWDFMDSDIEAKAEDLLLDYNMKVLAHYDNGFRCVTTSKVAVETPDDMNNLLIRTPENPVIMATMEALGANPQPLAFSELYMALQQGTYDAQENPVPVIYNNNLYEVQSYLSVTNHIYSGMCFTIADSTWNKMSDNQKTIVEAAALASQDFNRELNKSQTEELLVKLEETGMTIIEPELAPFAEETASVAEDLRDTYGELLDELEAWQASR